MSTLKRSIGHDSTPAVDTVNRFQTSLHFKMIVRYLLANALLPKLNYSTHFTKMLQHYFENLVFKD